MYRIQSKIYLLVSLLMFIVTPQISYAAHVLEAGADVAGDGISFRIAYNENTAAYEVYMTPSVTPAAPNLTLTAQVTIKVPHSEASKFTVNNLLSGVDGTEWSLSSRIDAPSENPDADYLSFTVDFPSGNHRAFSWTAGEELMVFSFENSNACLGAASLMDNSDTFASLPNSVNTNPGNQIDVLGLDGDNIFAGITGGAANCTIKDILDGYNIYLPITLK